MPSECSSYLKDSTLLRGNVQSYPRVVVDGIHPLLLLKCRDGDFCASTEVVVNRQHKATMVQKSLHHLVVQDELVLVVQNAHLDAKLHGNACLAFAKRWNIKGAT